MKLEELESIFELQAPQLASLSAYSDGTASMSLFLEETSLVWAENAGVYTLQFGVPGAVEENPDMKLTAELKDEQLILKLDEGDTVTTFTFKYIGKSSKIFNDWNLKMTDEQVNDMSIFINSGQFVISEGYLYGNFGGKEYAEGVFSVAKVNDTPDVEDMKIIEENSYGLYLTEYDGYVYGVMNGDKVVKIKPGESKYETIYEGVCDYFQILKIPKVFCNSSYR
jgi:hypothetical protein